MGVGLPVTPAEPGHLTTSHTGHRDDVDGGVEPQVAGTVKESP